MEENHRGFRSLTGYGISVTRGAAAAMSFSYSVILLTMCRNLITALRNTFLNSYVPFDAHVAFHKTIAYTALFFTVLHIIGYGFNFYHLGTQPKAFLCLLDEITFRSDELPKFHFWVTGNITGVTGLLLVLCISIMYVFATAWSRAHIYTAFWTTHRLYMLVYILTLLHGASRIIQDPAFYLYFLGPALLFTVDKLISLSVKKRELSVVSAEHLPSDVTYLKIKRPADFEYKSGQWVRIACVDINEDEYHPFTLTSAPSDDYLTVHIRSLGPWTWRMRRLYDSDRLQHAPFPKLYMDGPFGAGQQDWYRYDVSVLVGGGIGVTPYASILKDFVSMTTAKNVFRVKCRKLYFIWSTASHRQFEWLIEILRQVEAVDRNGTVEIHIFITQLFSRFDLRTTLLYIFEKNFRQMSSRSMFTSLRALTHFGRPNFTRFFDAVHKKHPKVDNIGVFSCGPSGLTKSVELGCIESTRETGAMFEHHYENF